MGGDSSSSEKKERIPKGEDYWNVFLRFIDHEFEGGQLYPNSRRGKIWLFLLSQGFLARMGWLWEKPFRDEC